MMNSWSGGVLIASGLVAGFVDSIGGGGGLISVPAFLNAGIPVPFLLGTNKCVGSFGTSVAVFRYARAGLLPRLSPRLWVLLGVAAAICSILGAALSQLSFVLNHLRILVPVMLMAVMIFLMRRWFWGSPKVQLVTEAGSIERLKSRSSVAAVGVLGGYDGLFGPGAGTFFLSYLEKLGFETLTANAITKVLNFSSNIGALAFFAFKERVNWGVGLPVAGAFMLGNYLGSGLVLKRGQMLVRFTVLTMTTLMLVRYAYSMI